MTKEPTAYEKMREKLCDIEDKYIAPLSCLDAHCDIMDSIDEYREAVAQEVNARKVPVEIGSDESYNTALNDAAAIIRASGIKEPTYDIEREIEAFKKLLPIFGEIEMSLMTNEQKIAAQQGNTKCILLLEKHTDGLTRAYEAGQEAIYATFEHEKNKFLDGLRHPKDCEMCAKPSPADTDEVK